MLDAIVHQNIQLVTIKYHWTQYQTSSGNKKVLVIRWIQLLCFEWLLSTFLCFFFLCSFVLTFFIKLFHPSLYFFCTVQPLGHRKFIKSMNWRWKGTTYWQETWVALFPYVKMEREGLVHSEWLNLYHGSTLLYLTLWAWWAYIYARMHLPLTTMSMYICTQYKQAPTTPSCKAKQDCGVNPCLLSSN